ncbi:hypothetical protein Tco_0133399, partial [Tanacetum coccineum]
SFLNFHGHLISKETGQPALLKEVEVGSCSGSVDFTVLFSNYMFSSKTSKLECDSKSFTLSDLCEFAMRSFKDAFEMRSELLNRYLEFNEGGEKQKWVRGGADSSFQEVQTCPTGSTNDNVSRQLLEDPIDWLGSLAATVPRNRHYHTATSYPKLQHCSVTVIGAIVGPPVNGGQRQSTTGQPSLDHRSMAAVNGGDRWSTTAVRDGQRWRTGCPPRTPIHPTVMMVVRQSTGGGQRGR